MPGQASNFQWTREENRHVHLQEVSQSYTFLGSFSLFVLRFFSALHNWELEMRPFHHVTTFAPRRVCEHSFARERTKQLLFSVEHNLNVQQASGIS